MGCMRLSSWNDATETETGALTMNLIICKDLHEERMQSCDWGVDIGIPLTGLVNFVFTIWLRSPCAGENDAINTWIITKPVNLTTFSSCGSICLSVLCPRSRGENRNHWSAIYGELAAFILSLWTTARWLDFMFATNMRFMPQAWPGLFRALDHAS